jgi:hypothetical protein
MQAIMQKIDIVVFVVTIVVFVVVIIIVVIIFGLTTKPRGGETNFSCSSKNSPATLAQMRKPIVVPKHACYLLVKTVQSDSWNGPCYCHYELYDSDVMLLLNFFQTSHEMSCTS